ncbi:MAG: methyl-accepting chemotaxis protein [Aminobacterium sp.]|uniref:methyl-accepting chemotaxis protein n=1 Tax=Aminobacterium sp. TaxID=1872491 RepID=UPI002B2109F9|nr:methyl-accepting chemotaxis protein [Aminobacterium sp.]MEA4877020.1 methyl-accepting chemotaxis protein [Aminobacterium sp.]
MTIKARLWGMLAVILIVIAVMTGITYYRGQSILVDTINKTGIETTREGTALIDGYFERLTGILNTSAESLRHSWVYLNLTDEDNIENFVTNLTNRNKREGIMNIYMGIEKNGRLADGTGWKEPEGYNVRERPWYKQAVNAGKVVLTDPYIDMVTNEVVLSIAMPIYDNSGALLGVVAEDVNLSSLSEIVASLKIYETGDSMLITHDGLIVSSPHAEDVMKSNLLKDSKFPEALRNVAQKMLDGEEGWATYSYGGVDKIVFYAPTKHGLPLAVFFPLAVITKIIRSLTGVLLIVSVIAIIVIALIVFTIARGLARSIRHMEEATNKIADGDLTTKFDTKGKDEIARISEHLNGMVDRLRDLVSSVKNEAVDTSQRAETLASLSEETVASMEEVAGAINQVLEMSESSSSALEETNASIQEVAASAQSAAKSATDGAEGSSKAVEITETAVEDVDSVINNIAEAVQGSKKGVKTIQSLGRSVADISGFVATITSIADQTNLLALNAAIEAARAGDAGRGFAVVAEEVRKLAEESAQAAQKVEVLIVELQKSSESSIGAANDTGRILEKTMNQASSAQEKLREAVAAVVKVSEAVQSIAAVSEEQAASSEEMTSAVQTVTESTTEVVQSVSNIKNASAETTKAAETIAQEAQNMSQAAETLLSLVSQFRVDSGQERTGLVPVK